ncbi:MAG: tetratricopeptide repeat protein [Chitinophagaceae bacterium]|nr:tetratricopeptide repeat protein [Oligoflexus sp.]
MRKLRLLILPLILTGTAFAADPDDKETNASKSEVSPESTASPPSESKDAAKPKTRPKLKKSEPKDTSEYGRAYESYKAGNPKEAASILRGLISDETAKGKASLLLGTMYFEKKKLKKAKQIFDLADDPPLTKDTAYAYGATYLKAEEYTKALRGLRASLKFKGPNRVLTLYDVGICYFKLGQYSRAERYFARTTPKSLPKGLARERQNYLAEIRKRHDELLSAFINVESDVNSVDMSREFDASGSASEDEWADVPQNASWGIKWKPGALLRQESTQNLNRGEGRDVSDRVTHRVGLRGFAGGNGAKGNSGSIEFAGGFAGYDVKTSQSQTFVLPGISGNFLSQERSQTSEDNVFLAFKPLMNFELSNAIRGEAGVSYDGLFPHMRSTHGWGQSEVFSRLRAEGKELDGGLEFAAQQPFDLNSHIQSNDTLVKADINQRLGDFSMRLNGENWKFGNTNFVQFDRDRMSLLDSRFKYHLGFASESKLGVSGSMTFGDIALRASYDYTTRKSDQPIERLNPNDDPETVAKQSNKRMFAISFPVFDSVSLNAAAGTQNLSAYTFRLRDTDTGSVTREYLTDVKETLFQLGISVSVVDWIKIRVNYSIGTYSYLNPLAKDDAFTSANPRASENSLMFIELSKSF